MTVATAQAIQYLNLAYFGRPADPASLSAWPASGQSLSQIVLRFTATSEYATNTVAPNSVVNTNGSRTFNDTNLINTFYQRLFGRLAAASEVAGWADALARGAVNYDYLGLTILNAGLNLPVGTEMRSVLIAKFDSAQLYTGILFNSPVSAAAYSTSAAIQDGIAYNLATTTTTPQTFAQATAAVAEMVADSGAGGGQTFTLTTSSDTATANRFVGDIGINAGVVLNTLNNGDRLTGSGTDASLNVTLVQNNGALGYTVTPALLSNISTVNAAFATVGGGNAGAVTLNLSNATGVRNVALSDSTEANVVSNIQSVLSNIAITNTASNQDFTFGANVLNGTTDAVTLALSAVTGGTVTIGAGYETISIVSGGSAANTITALAGSTPATLNISGTRGLTITNSLAAATTTINAANAAGNVAVTHTNAAVLTVTGGAGNDTITLGATYVGGADGTANRDIINGGAGTNTLSITSAVANVAVAQANVTNIQTIGISDAVVNNINLTRFASATGLTFAAGVGGNDFTFGSGNTVTFNAAAGNAARGYIIGGTGIADTLTLTKAAGAISLGNGAQTFTGVEVLNVNTNTTAGGALTFAGTLVMAPTAGGTSTVNVTGANNLVLTGAVTAANIDANGLTGTGSLQMTAGLAAAGRIVGSSQADSLVGSAGADIINAGAGNDTIFGGQGNDNLTGGTGNDRFDYNNVNQALDAITDYTVADDQFGIATGLVNAAVAAGNVYTAASFQARATVADIAVADSDKAVLVTAAQTTAQIEAVTNAALQTIVVVYNSTVGNAQLVYDADWSDAAGRTVLANLTSLTSAASISGITQTNFFEIA